MDSAADCDAQGDGVLAYGVGDWTPGEKKKPGGLTKLGVRADRGAGPLASAGACVREMEDELRGLEEWKEARATRLRSMERRYMGEIEEMYRARDGGAAEAPAGCAATAGDEEEAEMRRALQRLKEGVDEIAERQGDAAERLKREAMAVRHAHELTEGELRLLTTGSARIHGGGDAGAARGPVNGGARADDEEEDLGSISDDDDALGLDGIEDSLSSHLAEMDAVLAQMDLLSSDEAVADARGRVRDEEA